MRVMAQDILLGLAAASALAQAQSSPPLRERIETSAAIKPPVSSSVARASRATADSVDDLMRRVVAAAHIPGAAVALVRDGKVVKLSCYGTSNSELAVPVTRDTRFQIASATKMYTAVLLMRMVERGSLRLDEPITKFVANVPKEWDAITVRHLATHTSGMAPGNPDPSIVNTADAVQAALKAPIRWKPGERAQYGSLDFTVLQCILENVGGKPFSQLLQDELLAPAGLHHTSFDNAEQAGLQRIADVVPDRTDVYHWDGRKNRRYSFLYPKYTYAAGGAFASVEDMANFVAAVDSGRLLKPASLEIISAAPKLTGGAIGHFGIGWVVGRYRGHRWIGHSGGPALCDVIYFPDDHLGIVVMTNQQKLYPQLAKLVANHFIDPPKSYDDPGLPDDHARLTATARKVLEGTASGSVDEGLLAAASRDAVASDLNEAGQGWLGPLGPITRMTLLEDQPSGGSRTRKYRLMWGRHAQVVSFIFDKEGRISDVTPGDD
jgi:CubicO group peptidase (beta-lactamase class C family)